MKFLTCLFLCFLGLSALGADGYLAVTNGNIVIGPGGSGGTVSPTTLTQTNFVLNTVYTNGSQQAIVKASISLTTAAVNGASTMNLMADQAGGNTFALLSSNGITTTVAVSLAATDIRSMFGLLAGSATYYWTNASTGAGDSATIVAGTGQIQTVASGTNGAAGPSGSVTNLGALTFATNAGNVSLINLQVSSASPGTVEAYSLQFNGTNYLTVQGTADATSATNTFVALQQGALQFYTNSQASWPKTPATPGAFCIVSSNGLPYMLLSTNNAGGGSITWTGTNKLGW
jgi:hypothetical protein